MLLSDLLTKINEYEACKNHEAQLFNELTNWFNTNVDNDVVYQDFTLESSAPGSELVRDNIYIFLKQFASYGTAGCYYVKLNDIPLYLCATFIG